MILERFPELAQLPVEEKWQLMAEIEDDVLEGDVTMQEPLKSQIFRLLEARCSITGSIPKAHPLGKT